MSVRRQTVLAPLSKQLAPGQSFALAARTSKKMERGDFVVQERGEAPLAQPIAGGFSGWVVFQGL